MNEAVRTVMVLALAVTGFTAVAENETAPAAQRQPCDQIGAFHQFDFWLGEWDVQSASGEQYGVNHISREPGGCVLVERWQSVRGGTGVSLNYYDPEAAEWVQHWVGSDGSIVNIRGGLQAESMLLVGSIQYVGDGRTNRFRGLWTPLADGRVRQFFEESTDDGKTWETWFEGFYSPK